MSKTMSWLEKQCRENVGGETGVSPEELLAEYARAFEREANNDEDLYTQYQMVALKLRLIAAEVK